MRRDGADRVDAQLDKFAELAGRRREMGVAEGGDGGEQHRQIGVGKVLVVHERREERGADAPETLGDGWDDVVVVVVVRCAVIRLLSR